MTSKSIGNVFIDGRKVPVFSDGKGDSILILEGKLVPLLSGSPGPYQCQISDDFVISGDFAWQDSGSTTGSISGTQEEGRIYRPPPETPNHVPPHPHCFLALKVQYEQDYGLVRVDRHGYYAPVLFQMNSIEGFFFLAAWRAGEEGFSKAEWTKHVKSFCRQCLCEKYKTLEHFPSTDYKAFRRKVNDKLKPIDIRLKPRVPPQLIERN